jgi:hypothetical protein
LFILLVLSAFPDLFFWNPLLLSGAGLAIMTGAKELTDFIPAVLLSVALIVAALAFALARFRKAAL